MNILSDAVRSITIETRFTPPIVINEPFKSGGGTPGIGSQAAALLRPKITVQTALGPVTTAPWGEPGTSQWPLIQIGVASALAGAALFLLWRK